MQSSLVSLFSGSIGTFGMSSNKQGKFSDAWMVQLQKDGDLAMKKEPGFSCYISGMWENSSGHK